ncbi:MAG: peptidylprolyl isomerase [Tissierellia bacterium]|nr:peptidylprolyl isomerase [Tissierellia bacterium]
MNFKKKVGLIALTIILVVLATACSKNKPEGAVATVNGEPISEEIFEAYYRIQRDKVVMYYGEEALEQKLDPSSDMTQGEMLRRNILDQLAVNEAMVQEAKKANLEATDAEIEEEVNEILNEVGEEEFNNMLESLKISKETYMNMIKDTKTVDNYVQKKLDEFDVSDDEVKSYYEENKDDLKKVKASHILVETEEDAKNVIKRLENGEDFEEVAKEVSLDPGSAVSGGDVGFFSRGMMVPEFEEYAFSGAIGEVSEPVESQYGFHIIKVTEVKDDLDSAKEEITQLIKQRKLTEYIEDLSKKSVVRTFVDFKEEPESIKNEIEENKAETENNTEVEDKNENPEENKDESSGGK